LCGRRSRQKPVSIFKALRTPRRSLCDNVIDVSQFRFQYWPRNADHSRRIGLGITWLVDVLVTLGLTYGSDRSISLGVDIIRCICHSAHRASIALAKEKTRYPYFERHKYLQSPFILSLPQDVQDGMSAHGIGDRRYSKVPLSCP
jgi:ribonucleoside-diphosphate reductase alpha chain